MRFRYKCKVLFTLCCILIFTAASLNCNQPVYASNIVASINDIPITELDIKRRANLIIFSSGLKNDKKTYDAIKGKVLDMLIDEILIKQEAAKLKIIVDKDDLEDAMESLAEKNQVSMDELNELMKNKKVDMHELQHQLKHQILLNKIIRLHIYPNIYVSDTEVEENKEGIKKIASQKHQITDVRLAEILLQTSDTNNVERQMNLGKQLVKQIRAGADFGKIAREFSTASSAKNNGEIGWIPIAQMMPELTYILSRIEVGNISEPITLPDGIHILKVIDRKVISDPLKEFTNEEIKNILLNKKLDTRMRSYMRKLHNKAYIKIQG